MDKSQGQTIKKAMIYLGKFEATARLASRCFSRAKRLVDLLVEPMAFDRFSKLGDKSTLKIRLGSSQLKHFYDTGWDFLSYSYSRSRR